MVIVIFIIKKFYLFHTFSFFSILASSKIHMLMELSRKENIDKILWITIFFLWI